MAKTILSLAVAAVIYKVTDDNIFIAGYIFMIARPMLYVLNIKI